MTPTFINPANIPASINACLIVVTSYPEFWRAPHRATFVENCKGHTLDRCVVTRRWAYFCAQLRQYGFSECLTKEQRAYTTEGKSLNAIEEAMRRRSHLAYD